MLFLSGSLFNLSDKIFENIKMKRQKKIPIEVSEESYGLEVSCYGQFVKSFILLNIEFKPSFPGDFHFGAKQ